MVKVEILPRQSGKTTKLIKEFLMSSKDAYFFVPNNCVKTYIIDKCLELLFGMSLFNMCNSRDEGFIIDKLKQKIISVNSFEDFRIHFEGKLIEKLEFFCDEYYMWPPQVRENFYKMCVSNSIENITICSSLNKKISQKSLKVAKGIKKFMKEYEKYVEDFTITDFSYDTGVFELVDDFISDENVEFLVSERMQDFYNDSKNLLSKDRFELEFLGKIFIDDVKVYEEANLSNF